MIFKNTDYKIFDCGSNPKLAEEICERLHVETGKILIKNFADGETNVRIEEPIRGQDIFLVQSTSPPTNENIMNLLIIIDAARRASAGRINVIIPYYGYSRQEKKTLGREPITAKLVANLLTTAGADRIMFIDLHTAALQGFFDIPVDHLTANFLFEKYITDKNFEKEDVVVVSPDVGGASRARTLANLLHVQMAIIDKRRPAPNVCEIMNVVGNIENKICILVDDIADTSGTLVKAAEALHLNGAKEIYALVTHGILSDPAAERIRDSNIKEFVVTNTIPISNEKLQICSKIKIVSVGDLIAKAIKVIHEGGSITKLYNKFKNI